MRLPFNSVWYSIKDYLIIIFGLLLYALGWVGFLIPNEITTGGVTGISALIYYGTGIPISVSYFVINVLLLLAAIKVLGLQFCIRTIFSVIVCSSFLSILPLFIKDALVDEQPFMSAIIGGILCGSGIGLVFVSNGSTGGTDIIIKLLRLKFPYLKTGALFFLTDVVIVIASAFVFRNVDKALYAGIVVIITSVVLDVVLYGRDEAKLIYIISDHAEKIAGRLLEELDIGVTYVQGSGAYSGKEKSVIMCAMKKNISPKAEEIVKEEDPLAFMIVTSATEIFGEGYKSYFSEKL